MDANPAFENNNEVGKMVSYPTFFTDEHTRIVFVEFLHDKSEVIEATQRVMAKFNALVGTPVDEKGVALQRPRVRRLHRDHEGGLESRQFEAFRAREQLLQPLHVDRTQSTGHGSVLHAWASDDPGHAKPPCCGSTLFLWRVWVPPAHVAVQALNEPHSPTTQSTGTGTQADWPVDGWNLP